VRHIKEVGRRTVVAAGGLWVMRLASTREFISEVTILVDGLRKLNTEPILVFPELLVCFNYSKVEFVTRRGPEI